MSLAGQSDVLILGAGAAGVAAAIEAARRGASVRVLDATDGRANASWTCGGGIFIADSPLQASLGIDDSVELALEDWIAFGGPTVDVEWAQAYIERAVPELFEWLAETGVEWVGVNLHEGNRVPRWHAPKGSGFGVMSPLDRHARSLPIQFEQSIRVDEILLEGSRVVGLGAVGPDGDRREYRAGAVLIASGGFASSPEMVRKYTASLAPNVRVLCGGGGGAEGSGHRMLERVNAQFTFLDSIWCYPYATPDYEDPSGTRGLVCRGLEGDVWVNRAGRRFHNEDLRGGSSGTPAVLAQEGATCWTIIDAKIAARYNVADGRYRKDGQLLRDKHYRLLDESPFIARGASIQEVAARAGLPSDTLCETIREHNRQLAVGLERDPEFGRRLSDIAPLEEPPFYAMRLVPLARKNFGGVRTDLNCRVLDRDDRPIEGLFAAGEVAGMAGGHINGSAGLEGTMLGPVIYSGKVAGRAMAD